MTLRKDKILAGILAVLYIMIQVSCNSELEEEIKWQLDEHPDMLVVQGIVTNRLEKQVIYLSVTGPYLSSNEPEMVSGASVSVSDDDMNVYEFSETGKGIYESDTAFEGKPLHNYTLKISLDRTLNGVSEFTAMSRMPEGIELDTIICEIHAMPDIGLRMDEEEDDTTLLGIYYYGKEPDDPENYYLVRIYGNNVPWQVNAKEMIRFTDDFNNGSQSDFILFLKNVAPDDTITFEVNSVEKKYYDYIGSLQLMDQSGSAYSMSGPPANAVGNISGALGYFYATFRSEKMGIAIDRRN